MLTVSGGQRNDLSACVLSACSLRVTTAESWQYSDMRFVAILVVAGCASRPSSSAEMTSGTSDRAEAGVTAPADQSPAPGGSSPAPADPAQAGGGMAGATGSDAPVAADATRAPRPGDAAAAAGDAAPPIVFNPAACGEIAGALFCDDFESGLNPDLKPRMSGGGTVAVDQTRARGGKSSLHVKSLVRAYADGSVNLRSPVFPTATNNFFIRAFVYYAPPAPADNVYLISVSGQLPGTTTHAYVSMGTQGYPYNKPTAPNFKQLSTFIYHSDIKSADHKPYTNPTAPEVTFGRWACWEWQVDGPNNKWTVWVDGVEHMTRMWDGAAGTPWVVPTVSSISVGIHHDHDENPSGVEVWYDDLVVASKRVGCGPP